MTTPENKPLAIGFMLLASVLIAGTTLLAKVLGTDAAGDALHPLQISHGRFLFGWIAIMTAVAVMRPKFTRPDMKLHVARASFGWAGVSGMFAAVAFVPLATATAISFLNPVFAMLFAIPLLGEKVGPWRWCAAGMALVGAVILLRPGGTGFEPAALLALAAAALFGMEIILVKRLSGQEGALQILAINNSLGLILATIAVVWVWTPPTPGQWAALAGIGGMMACAQTCFIQSLRRADASFVVPFSYATLVFAALYDLVIFAVVPGGGAIAGAATIIAGGAVLAWREGRAAKAG